MENNKSSDRIRKIALDLDNAIENKNVDFLLFNFSADCEIELLGIKLTGKEGAKKWINWLYKHLVEIKFEPVTIMVDGNTFFEEFIVKGKLHNGIEVSSKQAEVLLFEDYKIKSLRLYFDRIDFADSVKDGFIIKTFIRKLIKTSLEGLI